MRSAATVLVLSVIQRCKRLLFADVTWFVVCVLFVYVYRMVEICMKAAIESFLHIFILYTSLRRMI